MDDSKLIFLISQPRAGSTLLQAILSNHEKIDTVSEPWVMLKFAKLFKSKRVYQSNHDKMVDIAFDDFLDKSVSSEVFKSEVSAMVLRMYSRLQTDPNNYFLDKTPRYYGIFDLLYSLFPNARYLFLIRNPLDVLKSIITTWKRPKITQLSDDVGKDIMEAPFIIQQIKEKYSKIDNLLFIYYEELVKYNDFEFEKLFNWLGLNYHSSLKDYSANTSFQGRYGDPIGVHRSTTIENKKPPWYETKTYKAHQGLFQGYAWYLGVEFLTKYGNYECPIQIRPTRSFKKLYFYYRRKSISKNRIEVCMGLYESLLALFANDNKIRRSTVSL